MRIFTKIKFGLEITGSGCRNGTLRLQHEGGVDYTIVLTADSRRSGISKVYEYKCECGPHLNMGGETAMYLTNQCDISIPRFLSVSHRFRPSCVFLCGVFLPEKIEQRIDIEDRPHIMMRDF